MLPLKKRRILAKAIEQPPQQPQIGFLPANMTYILQVLDLVVNGPLKAIRKLRAQRILDYFGEYKQLYKNEETKPENQRVKPKWSPPKPSMKQCILDIIDLIENKQFSKDKFQQGIRKTFISTGTSMQQDGSFVVYKHKTVKERLKLRLLEQLTNISMMKTN
jgi:hypothetical protein